MIITTLPSARGLMLAGATCRMEGMPLLASCLPRASSLCFAASAILTWYCNVFNDFGKGYKMMYENPTIPCNKG